MATRRAAQTLTPHPNPSPQGEGLNGGRLQTADLADASILLPRDKGTLEAKQKGRDEGQQELMKARARSLRRKSTDAEILLWQHLRDRRLLGLKFRHQVPIGNYIVDFFCEDVKMIIELDGGQHMEKELYDQVRSDWLVANGFRVVRYWNNDISNKLDAVLENLFSLLQETGARAST